MKGVILAGGKGTRLSPLTDTQSKHLLKINNKEMIFYPLNILINAGVNEILLVTNPEYMDAYKVILKDCSKIEMNYISQNRPDGLPDAIKLSEKFVGEDEQFIVILGDNYFSNDVQEKLKVGLEVNIGASIFLTEVDDPNNFGVVSTDKHGRIESIVEKPVIPKSNSIITGLYIFSKDVFQKIDLLKKSERGELEIVDLFTLYKEEGTLIGVQLDSEVEWLDMGTHDNLEKIDRILKEKNEGE